MAHNTLITGGARSGKSRFAEEMTLGFGGLACYLATAQALDDEMEERIHRHQFRRGNSWETIEEALMIPQTLARIDGIYSAILLDCVTLWLSNLLLSCDENDPGCEEQVLSHVHRLATTLRGMSTPVVLVTNEVGQGLCRKTGWGGSTATLPGRPTRFWPPAAITFMFVSAASR